MKTTTSKAPVVQAPKSEAAQPEQKPAMTVTKIKVLKKDAKFRGARDAWYKAIIGYDGKAKADFEKDMLAKPPSTPGKGALAGKCEPPSGWTSYFKRTGIIALEEVKA